MGPVHVSDARSERRRKRRCIDSEVFRKYNTDVSVNKSLVDATRNNIAAEEDYCGFLIASEGSADAHREDTDPQYELFLAQLRLDGNSYALQVSKGDGTPVLMKYEHKPCSDWQERGPPERPGSEPLKNRAENSENLREIPTKKRKVSLVEKNVSLELENPASCTPKESECKTERSVIPEESYKIFLNCIKWVGNSMVFVDKDGDKVIYEELNNAEASSDSEILGTDSVLHCREGKFTPFVTNPFNSMVDADEGCCIKNHLTSVRSAFRENLMSVLRRPYDHMEYENLWAQISERKPLRQHRDLRNNIKSYAVGRRSKSYLDQHHGLTKKIDLLKHDRHKVLNVLRGFFYWLKNLVHEGAFCPWLDESCLAVVPQSK